MSWGTCCETGKKTAVLSFPHLLTAYGRCGAAEQLRNWNREKSGVAGEAPALRLFPHQLTTADVGQQSGCGVSEGTKGRLGNDEAGAEL